MKTTFKFLQNVFICSLACFMSLGVAEIFFRKYLDIKVGFQFQTDWFKPVDSLYELSGFYTDSFGVIKVHPEARRYVDSICKNYSSATLPTGNIAFINDAHMSKICREVYGIEHDYFELKEGKVHNTLSQAYRSIISKSSSNRTEFESILVRYINSPINDDGFRSIEFKKHPSLKKRVLLLGDSFTWGHEATNLTNSFSDILLANGYVVYNSGITFTDPQQYLAVAKEYLEMLEPDVVVVNFFLGNDVVYQERTPIDNLHPPFFVTNAGFLNACPNGIHFQTANNTYRFILQNYEIPKTDKLGSLAHSSALATQVWRGLAYKNKISARPISLVDYYERAKKLETATPYSNITVKAIEKLCKQKGSHFLLIAIPNTQLDGTLRHVCDIPHLFDSLSFYEPPVTIFDYSFDDGHYNDKGHMKHALFLDSLLKKKYFF